MTFSRRGFITAAVVASAAPALPAVAAPIPAPPFTVPPPGMFVPDVMTQRVMKLVLYSVDAPETEWSPFDIARAYARGDCVRTPTMRGKLRIDKTCESHELREFDSFRDLLFSAFDVREIPPEGRTNVQPEWSKAIDEGRPFTGDMRGAARSEIRRQANRVAYSSRINVAQTFLYGGPNNAWAFAIDEFMEMNASGKFYPTWAAHETTVLTPDELVVMHHENLGGEVMRGAFAAQMLPGGRVRAIVREDSKSFGTILRAVE